VHRVVLGTERHELLSGTESLRRTFEVRQRTGQQIREPGESTANNIYSTTTLQELLSSTNPSKQTLPFQLQMFPSQPSRQLAYIDYYPLISSRSHFPMFPASGFYDDTQHWHPLSPSNSNLTASRILTHNHQETVEMFIKSLQGFRVSDQNTPPFI